LTIKAKTPEEKAAGTHRHDEAIIRKDGERARERPLW
jgi:hypothetical protein